MVEELWLNALSVIIFFVGEVRYGGRVTVQCSKVLCLNKEFVLIIMKVKITVSPKHKYLVWIGGPIP
jgi:hypothetical protein